MKLSEFDYDLPKELIAQFPSLDRAALRLLVVESSDLLEVLNHIQVDLIMLLRDGF